MTVQSVAWDIQCGREGRQLRLKEDVLRFVGEIAVITSAKSLRNIDAGPKDGLPDLVVFTGSKGASREAVPGHYHSGCSVRVLKEVSGKRVPVLGRVQSSR